MVKGVLCMPCTNVQGGQAVQVGRVEWVICLTMRQMCGIGLGGGGVYHVDKCAVSLARTSRITVAVHWRPGPRALAPRVAMSRVPGLSVPGKVHR